MLPGMDSYDQCWNAFNPEELNVFLDISCLEYSNCISKCLIILYIPTSSKNYYTFYQTSILPMYIIEHKHA